MATYYVRKNGSDGNAGTSAGAAWLTFNKALATLVAGDICWFGSGVYTTDGTAAANSGSGGNLISIFGDNDGSQTGDAGTIIIPSLNIGANFWNIAGFTFLSHTNSDLGQFGSINVIGLVLGTDSNVYNNIFNFQYENLAGTGSGRYVVVYGGGGTTNIYNNIFTGFMYSSVSGFYLNYNVIYINVATTNINIYNNSFIGIRTGSRFAGSSSGSNAIIRVGVSTTNYRFDNNYLSYCYIDGANNNSPNNVTQILSSVTNSFERYNISNLAKGTTGASDTDTSNSYGAGNIDVDKNFSIVSYSTNPGSTSGNYATTDIYGTPRPAFGKSTSFTPGAVEGTIGDIDLRRIDAKQIVPATKNNSIQYNSKASLEVSYPYTQFFRKVFWVTVRSGAVTTFTVAVRKNSSYGSSNLPRMRLENMPGVATQTSTMTDVNDSFQLLTVSGTPNADGLCKIVFECHSANSGASVYWSDINP